jgi:hypothetical protein
VTETPLAVETVRGAVLLPDRVTGLAGYVTYTPVILDQHGHVVALPLIRDTTGHALIEGGLREDLVGGRWSIALLPTDLPGLDPVGWLYRQRIYVAKQLVSEVVFELPTGSGPVEADDLVSVAPGGGPVFSSLVTVAAFDALEARVDDLEMNGGPGGGGAVSSVNTKTGAVVLTAADVVAEPAGTAAGLVGAEATTRATADQTLTTAAAAAQSRADAALARSGGTMTGALLLAGDPTNALQAATMQYVTARVAELLGGLAPADLDTFVEVASRIQAGDSALTALTNVVAGKQPLDDDLSAIAGLATSAYGRAFLTLTDQAALMSLIASATTTAAGLIELATTTETTTGTDAVRAVTPAGLKAVTDTLMANLLVAGNNLSDVPDKAAARTNLGLGNVATVPSATTSATLYVDPTNGNDSNSGVSWTLAKQTIAGALTAVASGFNNTARIQLSRGVHNVTSTLTIPQGVKFSGMGSLLSQETEIVWTGPDDGSYVIRTAGNTSGSDFTRGELSGFLVRPNATKPGGGAYTNLNGVHGRNMQNGSHVFDVRVQNFPGKGIMCDWSNAGVPAAGFPGWVTFSRVWSTGNNVDWHMFGGFTSVLFNMCAGDVSSNTTDVFIIDPPTGGSNGGRAANYVFVGFKSEDNGSPSGAGADPNYFTINTDVSIGFDGCSGKRGLPGTKPWINYTAAPASQNAVVGGAPIDIRNSHTSNVPVMVKGPDGTNWLTPAVGSGGQSFQVAHWSGQASAPKKWRGTHSGFVADGATVNASDGTVPALRVNAAPGSSVAPVEFAAPVFTHTFTAADSASAIPAPDTGPAGTAGGGTWGISSNKAYLASTTHNAIYYWAGVGSEGTLHADITRSAGQAAPGVALRVSDATHGLYVWYKSTTGELLLQKHNGSTPVGLKAATVAWTPGTTKRLSVSMAGPVITAYLDGVQVFTHTLTGGDEVTYASATGVGIRQLGNVTADSNADDGGSRYDNVSYVASVVRVNTAGALQVLVSGTWTTVSTGGGGMAGALLAANDLSDLASAPTARTNLGLGGAATKNVGTGSSDVAAGNDTRLSDARTPSAHAASHNLGGADALTFPARVIAKSTPTIGPGVVNTTTETDLFSFTVPASAITAGDTLVLEAAWDLLNNSGAAVNYTYKYKLGATTVLGPATVSQAASTNRFKVTAHIVISLATLTDQRWQGYQQQSGAVSTAMGVLANNNSQVGVGTSAEDLSTDKTLAVSITLGTAAAAADCRPVVAVLTRMR